MFPDVMVDIETTGVQPETTNIIQIAAVRFNLETREVDPNVFNQCLAPLPTRYWDEGTRQFWSKQPAHILDGIYSRMKPARAVMQDFYNWVGGQSPRLWAKPTHFEWMFLESYWREAELPNPFHYRKAVDLRSYILGLKVEDVEDEVPFEGDVHDALYDVFHQIKVLFAHENQRA